MRSVAPGVVRLVVEPGSPGFSGYGRSVVVSHAGNLDTLYAHLGSATVAPGDRVSAQQQLGTVGASCGTREQPALRCRGAHLHFELLRGRYPVASSTPRINPVGFKMPDAPDTGWQTLNQLIGELWESIPAPARTVELLSQLERWNDAYEQSQRGFGLSDAALQYWVDQYNLVRKQASDAGLTVPPAAKRRASWDENLLTSAREVAVAPAAAAASGMGFGLLLALAFYAWSQSRK